MTGARVVRMVAVFLALLIPPAAIADLLIPVRTYHIEQRPNQNEEPWGLGYEHRNWFAIGFKDSKRNPSWAAGRRFNLAGGDTVRLDALAFVMTRQDVGDYRPFPGVLPVVSVGDRWRLESTIIPRLPDTKGPIIFAWVSFRGM